MRHLCSLYQSFTFLRTFYYLHTWINRLHPILERVHDRVGDVGDAGDTRCQAGHEPTVGVQRADVSGSGHQLTQRLANAGGDGLEDPATELTWGGEW